MSKKGGMIRGVVGGEKERVVQKNMSEREGEGPSGAAGGGGDGEVLAEML